MKNRVKALRQKANLSQQQLAQHLGVTRQSIISIERGRFDPSLELALRLAQWFQTPVEEIFFPGKH